MVIDFGGVVGIVSSSSVITVTRESAKVMGLEVGVRRSRPPTRLSISFFLVINNPDRQSMEASGMQILIIISSDSPEIKWNAVRFGNFLLNAGEDVTIFLNGPGVDLYDGDSEQFPISGEAKLFSLSDGLLAA